MRSLSTHFALLSLLAMAPSLAMAQEPPATPPEEDKILVVEPTGAQQEMNSKAIAAVNERNFETAITLFKASIELGELNITYLNMGRTYQRMGECVKAKETYRKARLTKYKVPLPTYDVVDKALNEYETELYDSCTTGELVMSCEPRQLSLFVGVKGPLACPSGENPLRLEEGEYVITGELEGYEKKRLAAVTINRVERTNVVIKLDKTKVVELPEKDPVIITKPEEKDPEATKPQPINIVINTGEEQDKKGSTAGKVLVISGLAAAALAVTWDTCALSWFGQTQALGGSGDAGWQGPAFCQHTHNGERDGIKDAGPLILYGLGAALTITGAVVF